MSLVLKEKIVLSTPQGESEVQLLFGNITNLPVEEKVDTIFVSSFPGDYSAANTSLIGALKRNLDIDVGKLARDKDVNLLHSFNCWVSKPLPDRLPFRRLVCFERQRNQGLPEQISGIFRAMMPVFNNQDTSVITPLLATGNQHHPKGEVLKATVTAACQWIKAGLPLRCLKIVVFMQNMLSPGESDVKLATQFQQYKKQWEGKMRKVESQKKYDVCVCYAGGDEALAGEVCSGLQRASTSIVIFRGRFKFNHNLVWQEHIFDVMVNSCRILTVLTPSYLEDVECLDQFSLALCCNRLSGTDVLVPFYLQTVPAFPSYMTVIQYTDCRVRKDGDVKEEKITMACSSLVEHLGENKQQQETQPKQARVTSTEGDTSYDVFISYAHRTPKEAGLLYSALQEADPNLNIFLDRNELRTGNMWEEALYEAVDGARMVVAFLSLSYLQSTVCQEEYNIALARFLAQDGLFLVPVLIEDVQDIPVSFALADMVDLRDSGEREDGETYRKLAEAFIGYLRKRQHNRFSQPAKKMNMASTLDEWRRHQFQQRFEFEPDKTDAIKLKGDPQTAEQASKLPQTVALSFTNDCLQQASSLSHLLRKQTEGSVTVELSSSQDPSGAQASKLLDAADMVVVFLSDEYMASVQHRTELHIALCRQRTTKDRPVVYLIEAHHAMMPPTYPYLLPHSINLGDRHWITLARNARKLKSKESVEVQLSGGMKMRVYITGVEHMALLTAAIDIAHKLTTGGSSGDSGIPVNIVNLASAKQLGEPGMEPVEKHLVPFPTLNSETTKNAKIITLADENESILEEADRTTELLEQSEGEISRNPHQKQSSACHLL